MNREECTVLLVDDEEHVLEGLRRVLRNERYQLVTASSAAAAIAIVKTRRVDVVVADEHMPNCSGTELLRILRETFPGILAIMLTGKADLEVALRAINQGEVYRFLTKPCPQLELTVAIREALKQKEIVTQCRKLIDHMRRQQKFLSELENANPGILDVKRTASGAIELDSTDSIDLVLDSLEKELDSAV
ncbi:MAG: response regulator [Bdellovibrionota bacterium]